MAQSYKKPTASKKTPNKPQPAIKPNTVRKGIGPSRAPSRGTR